MSRSVMSRVFFCVLLCGGLFGCEKQPVPGNEPTEQTTAKPGVCDPPCDQYSTCEDGKCVDSCDDACGEDQICVAGACKDIQRNEDGSISVSVGPATETTTAPETTSPEESDAGADSDVGGDDEKDKVLSALDKVEAMLTGQIDAIKKKDSEYAYKEMYEELQFRDFIRCVRDDIASDGAPEGGVSKKQARQCREVEDFASSRKTRFGKMLARALEPEEIPIVEAAIDDWKARHIKKKK